MTIIHPHWDATDADDASVRAAAPETVVPVRNDLRPVQISRKPAAVLGVLFAIGIGVFVLQGLPSLRGQLSEGASVRITADGLEPKVLTVQAGESITWTNEDDIPHILASDTLVTAASAMLDTPAIFPGTSFTETVSTTLQPGTYPYESKTSTAIEGEIIVQAGGATSSAASSLPLAIAPPVIPQLVEENPSFVSVGPDPAPSVPSQNALPWNPYTVGSPQQQMIGGIAFPTEANLAASEHKPLSNAETGPGIVLVFGGSVALLYATTRRAFRRLT